MPTRSGRQRICLFAQYNDAPALPAHVFHTWRGLRDAGFSVHAAVSGKADVAQADVQRLASLGVRVLTRPNIGHDFGAWSALVAAGAAEDADEILIANDSVLGPFADLAPVMGRMAGYDAWGMVMSREGRPHLQSWFVRMTCEAFARPAVRRVFEQDFASMAKGEIIVHGEFGLTAALEAEGLDLGAVWRSEFRLRPSRLVATNPMHFRWREMLDEGVPFLKRDLVERNPARIIGAAGWRDELRRRGWTADWIDEVAAAGPDRPTRAKQVLLQLAVREGRAGLLRALLSGG